jgi:hypothetical protein
MLPLTASPKFIKVTEKELVKSLSLLKGNFVRVVFDHYVKKDDWDKIKEIIVTSGGARWAEEWFDLPETTASLSEGSYAPTIDIEDMIDPFVDGEDTSPLDASLLKKVGHDFLRSCR